MWRILIGAIAFAVVIVLATSLTLIRSDIPFAELEKRHRLASSKYIEMYEGFRVHYLDTQLGQPDLTEQLPTLLVIHDLTSSAYEWIEWAREAHGKFRIIAVDLPAHGQSFAHLPPDISPDQFIADFADRLTLKNHVLVGSGYGGVMALKYALNSNSKLKALVLIGLPDIKSETAKEIDDPFIKDIHTYGWASPFLTKMDWEFVLQARLTRAFGSQELIPAGLITANTDFIRAPEHRRKLLEYGQSYFTYLQNISPETLKLPTLILHGDQDKIAPLSAARNMHAHIKDSLFVIYEKLGHYPHIETPRKTMSDVEAFLNEMPLKTHDSTHQVIESVPLPN